MSVRDRLIEAFARAYGAAPEIVARAPGRINLIGEHTDYNEGFVLPMAIDLGAWIAARARTDSIVRLESLDFPAPCRFDLREFEREAEPWCEYVKAVAWSLQREGCALRGLEGVVASELPVGAGLSSSAALELAAARVFIAASGIEWNARAMALACHRAENEWVGVHCGIMDQFISALGIEGHGLLMDCRSLETRAAPLPGAWSVVILDTTTRRRLADSTYNLRREECEAAARAIGVRSLRDANAESLEHDTRSLGPIALRRARHVISENARTLAAADALAAGDAEAFGRLMNESHESLRRDYEVSSRELDCLVAAARGAPGCAGARMTGAGFGGCAIALVRASEVERFKREASAAYERATGLRAWIHPARAVAGAEIVAPQPEIAGSLC